MGNPQIHCFQDEAFVTEILYDVSLIYNQTLYNIGQYNNEHFTMLSD